jgi:hypothetical protein
MRTPFSLLGPFLLALSPFVTGCDNECSYFQSCDGNTLLLCGGPDQSFGRKPVASPCTAPNPICVENGEYAACVAAPATQCDATSAATCTSSDQTLACNTDSPVPYLVATSCSGVNPICAQKGDAAGCVASPETACTSGAAPTCADGNLLQCDPARTGLTFLVATPCADLSSPEPACVFDPSSYASTCAP